MIHISYFGIPSWRCAKKLNWEPKTGFEPVMNPILNPIWTQPEPWVVICFACKHIPWNRQTRIEPFRNLFQTSQTRSLPPKQPAYNPNHFHKKKGFPFFDPTWRLTTRMGFLGQNRICVYCLTKDFYPYFCSSMYFDPYLHLQTHFKELMICQELLQSGLTNS